MPSPLCIAAALALAASPFLNSSGDAPRCKTFDTPRSESENGSPTNGGNANGDKETPVPVRHHPHDVCSVVRLAPNFPQDTSVFTASYGSMNLFLRSRNRGFGWANTRSGMLGYKISDIAIAPDSLKSELIFVALAEAGLQRSRDGGTVWEPPLVTSMVTEVEVGELKNGKRLVVCAGGQSVYHSTDGGTKWSSLATIDEPVLTLAIPAGATENPIIAVGTKTSVLVKNGERDWTSASVPSAAHTLEFSPNFGADKTMWVGTYGHGLFVSIDGGRSFQPTVGESPALINDIVVAPTWPKCKDIYVATPRNGVHVTRDGAKTWGKLNFPIAETYQTDNHYQCLAISSQYPEDPTVYCGCYEGLYCSNDKGEHWFETVLNPTRIGRKVAASPNYKNDGTVFMSGYGNPIIATRDKGESWETLSRGVKMMSPYSLVTSPTYAKDKLVLLGTGSGIRRSVNGGKSWQIIPLKPVSPSHNIGSYETRQLAFSEDFANDNMCFAVTAAGFYTSSDAGKTWKGHEVAPDWTWRISIVPNWTKNKTAFMGGYNVWRTTDGGNYWRKLMPTGKTLGLVCAPDYEKSGEVFLVSQSKGLMRSRDRGDTWQPITGSFHGYSPTKIRLSPNFEQDSTVFVSTVSGGMFKSVDRGDSWKQCAPLGGLGDACFDFIISPDYGADKTIFACTFGGMIRTTDDAKTWKLLTDLELYDDERDPWILRGGWVAAYNNRHLGYGVRRCRTPGGSANMGFSGSAMTLYGETTSDSGICEVHLDGKLVATVDLYSKRANREFVIYKNDSMKQGFHSISLRATGRANPRSSGTWVAVDGMTVRYQAVDDENELFADLTTLYLDASASYGRDTIGQNKKVKGIRAKLDGKRTGTANKPATGAAATKQSLNDPMQLTTQTADLREHLKALRSHMESLTYSIEQLQARLIALDAAIREKEKALEQAARPKKK